MSDEIIKRLRDRVDSLEEASRDLRMLFSDQDFEIRKDVNLTMSSIGIALYELQQTMKQQTDILHNIDTRLVRLETRADTDDAARLDRQGVVDAKLDAMQAEIRRPWWRRGKP